MQKWPLFVLVGASAFAANPPNAQQPADLTNMSLESLMATEVTSASRKSQRLSDTAAAVYVITSDEIRRSGLTSVPELLRLAPGVQVARIDASRWAISVRGFNGEFSNKLLVLMDGRTVYSELFSGVYWDRQDMILEDIDRIEVIRGPGATMWGANAVNGVINIISKNARDTQGSLVSVMAGNEERPVAAFRFGGRLGPVTWYRFFAGASNQHTPAPGMPRDTAWGALQLGFRADSEITSRDKLMVQAAFRGNDERYYRDLRLLSPPWAARTQSDVSNFDAFVLARWTRRINAGEITLQAYYDQTKLSDVWRTEGAKTGDIEFQHRKRIAPRHEINWGAGLRTFSDYMTPKSYWLNPPQFQGQKSSLFVQDEWALVPEAVTLTLGTKFEHNYFTGWETEPSARLLWTPTSRQSIWTSVSQAVRMPSRVDRGVETRGVTFGGANGLPVLVPLLGDPGFVSERLRSYEFGYRRQITSRLSLDSSGFLNRYRNLTGYRQGDPTLAFSDATLYVNLPLYLQNLASARSYGGELSANASITQRWRASGSYSWLKLLMNDETLVHQENGKDQLNFGAPNAPQHQGQARTDIDLGHGWSMEAAYYRVGGIALMGVPGYSRLDARFSWRPNSMTEFSLNGQNLLTPEHIEFRSEGVQQMFPIRRSAYVKLAFWF